jgi:hypothetical protein
LIFFGAFGAFVQMSGAKVESLRFAEQRLRAVHAAESHLEQLRAGELGAGAYPLEHGPVPMLATVTVREPSDIGLRRAAVEVRWRGVGGGEESVRLETVIR